MENLMTVKRSESIGNLAAALVRFNKEIKNIHKNIDGAKGKNDTKARYKYFDIAQLLEHVRQPLADVGLSVMQFNINSETPDVIGCITMLLHESGEFIESPPTYAKLDNPINQYGNKNMSDLQAYGSLISYVRRYSLCSCLGLAGDNDDNDGARIEINDDNNGARIETNYNNYGTLNKTKNNTEYQAKQTNHNTVLASEKQVSYLKNLLKNNGYSDDMKYTTFCNETIGTKKKVAELTKLEANKMIEILTKNNNPSAYMQ